MDAMRIDDALERFMRQLRADGRAEGTLGQYRRHVLLLARWAAVEGLDGHVEAFEHELVARFLGSDAALTRPDGRPKKPSAVNALRGSVRGFFGYLHRAGFVPEDAGRLVRRARCGVPPPKTLSEADQERLLATLAKAEGDAARRDHALFSFLLGTGARVGAALALTVEDLDLEGGEAVLRRCKGGRTERVFLPDSLGGHLRRYVGDRTSGALFPGQGGEPISARHAHRRLRYWLEVSGARTVSPHALRHTFAVRLYRRRRDHPPRAPGPRPPLAQQHHALREGRGRGTARGHAGLQLKGAGSLANHQPQERGARASRDDKLLA